MIGQRRARNASSQAKGAVLSDVARAVALVAQVQPFPVVGPLFCRNVVVVALLFPELGVYLVKRRRYV